MQRGHNPQIHPAFKKSTGLNPVWHCVCSLLILYRVRFRTRGQFGQGQDTADFHSFFNCPSLAGIGQKFNSIRITGNCLLACLLKD